MALTLNLATLESRKVDEKLKAKRTSSKLAKSVGKTGVFSRLARFGGWAIGGLFNFFNIDFGSIWDSFVDAYFEIKEFDWNSTDKELEAQIEQNNQQILSEGAQFLGEQLGLGTVRIANLFIGKFLGTRGRGAAAAQGIKVPVLSKRIAMSLAEEQNSELRNGVEQFLRSASQAMISNSMINFVLTARRSELFGMQSITQEIGIDGSIAAKVEAKLEKLPKNWQRPVESFLEGFEDGVINAGYVITDEADDHVAIGRYLQGERLQGEELQTLEVWPEGNSDSKSAPLVFTGRRDEIQESARTILPAYPLLGRDDGGIPFVWNLRPGADRPQLVVSLRTKQSRSTYSLHIPHYAGGKSVVFPPYRKGPWLGYWILSDGSKLQIYCASKSEARKMIRFMGGLVEARYRKGKPVVRESDRDIRTELVSPVYAKFYKKGIKGPQSWIHTFT